MLCRGLRAAKILSQYGWAERSCRTQCPGERLAPACKLETRQAGVQIRTPAWEPGLRGRLDLTARSLQPTQVRITGIPDARRSARAVIPAVSLPCLCVWNTRREPHRRVN